MVPPDDLWGCLTAVELAGVGDITQEPGPWRLCQAWRTPADAPAVDPSYGGHAFFLVRYDEATDKALVLEAVQGDYLPIPTQGVGFRGLGPINLYAPLLPGPEWVQAPHVPTLQQLRERYPWLRMARLDILQLHSW